MYITYTYHMQSADQEHIAHGTNLMQFELTSIKWYDDGNADAAAHVAAAAPAGIAVERHFVCRVNSYFSLYDIIVISFSNKYL